MAPWVLPLSTHAIPAPLLLTTEAGEILVQSPSSRSIVWSNPSLEHELVIPPKMTRLDSSEVMAILANAWGGKPSLAPSENVGVVVLSYLISDRLQVALRHAGETYREDQNIIGNLVVCGRDLPANNVHCRLRWHIYSLMSPSSGRVQPKRDRDQSQCRKNDRLHRREAIPDRGEYLEKRVVLVQR